MSDVVIPAADSTRAAGVPGATIAVPSVPNLRDLGGWPTRDGGRVRAGLLYRSVGLSGLRGDDLAAFGRLGIRTVYDLRTEAERGMQPDRLPPETRHFALDVLAGSSTSAPVHLMRALSDPATAREAVGDGKGVAFFVGAYREFVRLDSARAGYGRLFSDLAAEANRPALVHCTTGKDRTGWAVASLLMLLGVADDDVMREYLLSNAALVPMVQPMLDGFAAAGGDPDLLRPLAGVREGVFEGGARRDAGAPRLDRGIRRRRARARRADCDRPPRRVRGTPACLRFVTIASDRCRGRPRPGRRPGLRRRGRGSRALDDFLRESAEDGFDRAHSRFCHRLPSSVRPAERAEPGRLESSRRAS